MKNKKIVKHKKTGEYYLVESYYKDLYICYELMGYISEDNFSSDGSPNVLTNVIKQYFLKKKDLCYLNNREKNILNNEYTKYFANFHQFNDEFSQEYYEEDTYEGQQEYLQKCENIWCANISEY
jgi:hypothetical protein